MITVYITCKDEKEAKKISKSLLKKKLIACANFFPIQSMYWWQGKVEESKEFVIFAKSQDSKYDSIVNEVKKLSSYEVPCIEMIKSTANKEYLRWMIESTTSKK